ncbi:MAG: hypothetical protein ACK4P3_03460 [Fimbriimonadaceae bacterium]
MKVVDVGHRIEELLEPMEGVRSYTTWQIDGDGREFVGVGDYDSQEVWKTAGAAVADSKILDDVAESIDSMLEFRLVRIAQVLGQRPENTVVGEFLSLTDRRADMGYGDDLEQELGRIMGELSVIEGFIGALYGRDNSSEDEVLAVALWRRKFAFENSLPAGRPHDVRLYQRIA